MKKLFLLAILLAATSVFAQEWKTLMEPEIKATLTDIFMVSATEGWAVGGGGAIYHTTDGFTTFEVQNSTVTKDLSKVFFVDKNNGWVGTAKGSLLKTTNGGATWKEYDFSTVKPASFGFTVFETMHFVNSSLGFWIAGKSKFEYLFKTTDGGLTWNIKDSLVISSTTSYWTDIRFFNATKGVVVGDDKGTQKYTTDGGETWQKGDDVVYSPFKYSTVRYINENVLVCLGEGNEFNKFLLPVFKSTDGGKTWKDITVATPAVYDRVKDIYFKDDKNGLAVGNNGFSKMFIYKTADGGDTWTASDADFSTGFLALEGFGNTVFAIGSSGHILKSTDFGTTWTELKFKSPSSISSIGFNGINGYAINTNGDFFYSLNNGASWQFKSTTGKWNAGVVKFVNATTGFALKENRHILKTTDAGTTWKTVLEPDVFSSQSKVGGLCMANENVGYAWFSLSLYANYYMYKTVDGGNTWTQIYNDAAGAGYLSGNVVFFDDKQGVQAGPRLKVGTAYVYWLKLTTDGGTTWKDATVNGRPSALAIESINDAALIEGNKAIFVTPKTMFITSDKGATWNYVNHGVTGIDTSFSSVYFNGKNGIVLLSGGGMLLTKDGGTTWTKDLTGIGKNLYRASLNANNIPVLATNSGIIYSLGAVSGIKYDHNVIATNYVLEQNYPNPFNPSTKISYSLPKQSKVKLEIFDMLGKHITTLVDETQSAGQYKVDCNFGNIASGVYIYRLTTPDQTLAKKMLLLR